MLELCVGCLGPLHTGNTAVFPPAFLMRVNIISQNLIYLPRQVKSSHIFSWGISFNSMFLCLFIYLGGHWGLKIWNDMSGITQIAVDRFLSVASFFSLPLSFCYPFSLPFSLLLPILSSLLSSLRLCLNRYKWDTHQCWSKHCRCINGKFVPCFSFYVFTLLLG